MIKDVFDEMAAARAEKREEAARNIALARAEAAAAAEEEEDGDDDLDAVAADEDEEYEALMEELYSPSIRLVVGNEFCLVFMHKCLCY